MKINEGLNIGSLTSDAVTEEDRSIVEEAAQLIRHTKERITKSKEQILERRCAMKQYVAIIGGTNIKYGLINEAETLVEHEMPTGLWVFRCPRMKRCWPI